MMTNRQMLALILRRQTALEALVLMVLREERNIELSQEDIDAAVAALGSTANDLVEMANTTNDRITDVDIEVQALKAQLAAQSTPVDTSALDAAVSKLNDAHNMLSNAVQSLADDANVPSAGQATAVPDTAEVGGDGTGASGTEEGTPIGEPVGSDTTATTEQPLAPGTEGDVTVNDQS
jgi:chromosome condensin MukBEF ATPase and DNA-binding subunit MukB